MSNPLQVGRRTRENSLQVALSVAGIPRNPQAIATRQGREAAFHTIAVFMVLFLERFRLLALAGFLQGGLSESHTDRAAFLQREFS
jgi:hypothetical protein